MKTGSVIAVLLLLVTLISCNQDIAGTADDGIKSAQTINYSVGDDELCPAGTYSSDGTGPDCIAAPVGTYVPTAGSIEAIPCPVGRYQDEIGQTSCKLAQPGTFVSVVGAASAELCPLGKYQDLEGQTSCKDADPGSFVSFKGAAQAELCPIGTFSTVSGSSECTSCGIGETTAGRGAIVCILIEDPTSKADCKQGGWDEYGFKNQGQCIRFVNTGKDSR